MEIAVFCAESPFLKFDIIIANLLHGQYTIIMLVTSDPVMNTEYSVNLYFSHVFTL